MAIAIAGAALALTAFGTYEQYKGQKAQASAQSEAITEQQQADAQRQQAMNLEAARRQRELVRQSIASQSQARTIATNQGAGSGSGLPGAQGGISGRLGVGELGVTQNQEIGNNIFSINSQISNTYRRAAAAGSTAMLGAGMSSLGQSLARNEGSILKVGTYLGSFGGA